MQPTIAIDFGTSNSAVAWVDEDGTVHVPGVDATDPAAATATPVRGKAFPTWVATDEQGELRYAGAAARARLTTHPGTVIHSFKPLVGRTWLQAEADGALQRLAVPVEPDPQTGRCLFAAGGRLIGVEQACAFLLAQMREQAQAQSGRVFADLVLSVPAYHTEWQIGAMLDAARMAGFYGRVDIVREPLAAALAVDTPLTPRPSRVIVVDLGGGTLDITAAELRRVAPGPTGLRCDNLANAGDNALGGLAFDDRVLALLRRRFELQDLSDTDMSRLRTLAEQARVALSEQHVVPVAFELGGTMHRHALTRHELELALRDEPKDLLAAIEAQVRAVLAAARLAAADVDLVALVGGPTATPCVRDVVRRCFHRNERVLRHLDDARVVDPMLAVAMGAAKYRATEHVARHPFGWGFVAVTASRVRKGRGWRVRREPVVVIPPNSVYPSVPRTVDAPVAAYRGDKVVGVEVIQCLPPDDPDAQAGPYRYAGTHRLAVDIDAFGVDLQVTARLNEVGELEMTLANRLDGREVTYVGCAGQRLPIQLPTETVVQHEGASGQWTFVADYSGMVLRWAQQLLHRLGGAAAVQDRHLRESLLALEAACARPAAARGDERQLNDIYLAGRSALARAHGLRLLADPAAASLEAELERARRACFRFDEYPEDSGVTA